jgi:integral membrane protein
VSAETEVAAAAPVTVPKPILGALLRYRVIAYVVGVGLILLVVVGVPLKYTADISWVVAVVGPLHGVLYVVYLLLTLDLARRIRMNPLVAVAVMLAGTIPFLSFVAERKISAYVLGPQSRRSAGAARSTA